MDADDLLRETFAEYADRAPSATGLAAEVRHRAARNRRQGWAVVGAAAAGVVALAVAAVAFVPGHVARKPAAFPPPGTQRIYGHGIEAYVPAEWKVDDQHCGTPLRDTVLIHPGGLYCFVPEPPGLTVAYLQSDDAFNSATKSMDGLDSRAATMSGHPALLVTGRTRPRNGEPVRAVSAVVLPDLQGAFWVVSPDAEVAARIAATARVADPDFQGCAPTVDSPYATQPPLRAEAATELVPPGVTKARACHYDRQLAVDDWRTLTRAEIDDLRRVLSELPRGFGDPPPRVNRHCENDLVAPLVVTFEYASGPDVVVHLNLFGCEQLSASNGAVHAGYDGALIKQMAKLGGDVNGVPSAWAEIEPTS